MDNNLRLKRKKKIRKKLFGTLQRPRLCVYRSLKYLEAQAIDDNAGTTILAIKFLKKDLETKTREFAIQLKDKKIKKIVFDRGGFAYHGIIKKFADVLRKEGLEF